MSAGSYRLQRRWTSTPAPYICVNKNNSQGGVGIVDEPKIQLKAVPIRSYSSTFECFAARISSGQWSCLVDNYYNLYLPSWLFSCVCNYLHRTGWSVETYRHTRSSLACWWHEHIDLNVNLILTQLSLVIWCHMGWFNVSMDRCPTWSWWNPGRVMYTYVIT